MKDLDRSEIRRLRSLKWSWKAIGNLLGADQQTVRCRVDPDYAQKVERKWRDQAEARAMGGKMFSPEELNLRIGYGPKLSDDILAKRDYRLSLPQRDLTGEIMGDPRVGESALDRKMAGVGA